MATSKNELKSGTRGSNVVSLITQDMIRKDFKAVQSLEGKTAQAKALLRRHVLQHTINNVETVQEWKRRYDALKSKTTGDTATKARNAATDYFRLWFDIKSSSDSKSAIARAAITATRSALELVQECVAVYTLSDSKTRFGDGFRFAKDGKTQIKRDTPLGDNMWAHMKYEKVEGLTGDEYAETHPYMDVVDTTSQRYPGHVAWSDVRAMLLDKTGQDRTGSAAAKAAKIDQTKPNEALSILASTAKHNKDAYQLGDNKTAALDSVEAILDVAFNSPLFAPGWESVHKGFAMWRKELGTKVEKVPSVSPATVANMTGKDAINLFARKGDLATPASAKSLPHPKGQAANTASKKSASK